MRFSYLPISVKAVIALFFGVALFAPLPFVVVMPGGATDVLEKVISINSKDSYKPSGSLYLLAIRVTSPGSAMYSGEIVYGWIKGDSRIFPRSLVYPDNVSSEVIDKENEISKSISQPFFKTSAEFEFGNENVVKFNGVLQNGTKLYQFESEEKVKTFLEQFSKKTEFKVVSVENKKSIRKPSPPFITSSLQQEASTKLRFSVKKTMDVAQKIYEAGWITYMRSDCPNISKEAMDEAKKYIVKTFGSEYSDPKNYESKNASSQDAHECIRPTHIDIPEPEGLEGDHKKLYTLIWKRTIASQMTNAQINIQTIQTDATIHSGKESLLLFGKIQTYFTSSLENVDFPGYLIVYDNTPEDEEKVTGQLTIKPKDRLGMCKIKVCEEYTKPPLRYNEAALVRYLEKNGIGRPSTYASNISKVIERNYVEIKDVEGVKKQSRQFELSSKYNIKESSTTDIK
jgi:DNA topoisomerase-1